MHVPNPPASSSSALYNDSSLLYSLGGIAVLLFYCVYCLASARKTSCKRCAPPHQSSDQGLGPTLINAGMASLQSQYSAYSGSEENEPRYFDLSPFGNYESIYDPPLKAIIPSAVTSGDLAALVQCRNLGEEVDLEKAIQETSEFAAPPSYSSSQPEENSTEKQNGASIEADHFEIYQDIDTSDTWTRIIREYVGR